MTRVLCQRQVNGVQRGVIFSDDDGVMPQSSANAPAARLLWIDDDRELTTMLREFLMLQGFEVELRGDAESGLERLAQGKLDLLILDVMLPGASGLAALKTLRATSDIPVIMLTAKGAESDRVLGLMGGADDYLGKPFSPLELTARIQAILKRTRSVPHDGTRETLRVGALMLEPARREVLAGDVPLTLTAAEYRVLEQFMRHPDEVLTRALLTERALDRSIEAYDRSIDTLVSKLKKKLATAGIDEECIRGLRGHGYVLDQARAVLR